jgi:hypothetical protein
MAAAVVHLDTGFLIRAIVDGSREEGELRHWVSRGLRIGVSTIAWCEFLCGPLDDSSLKVATELVGEPHTFVPADSALAAEFFNHPDGGAESCAIA